MTGTTFSIPNGGVVNSMIADSSVTDTKIADNSVTNAKIAPSTITFSRFGQNGATTGQAIIWNGTQWVAGTPASSGWQRNGNAGTVDGTDFLGTTDNVPLNFRVNNSRAFRIEPNDFSPNIIGGFNGNNVTAGVYGATIGGGGLSGSVNKVTANFGTVGGGAFNTASNVATVGGGFSNTASSNYATVGGGFSNTASSNYATVGGGYSNTASGDAATVGGGASNTAQGDYSYAAGNRAKAIHRGSFVWGDSTNADVASTGTNQFIVRASGGVWFGNNSSPDLTNGFINTSTGAYLTTGGAWTNTSDVNLKTNFAPVDGREVVQKIASMPVQTWNYKAENASVRHMGPTAQDFRAAFGLGQDDTSISTVDSGGVALAGVQGLYGYIQEQKAKIEEQQKQIDSLTQKLYRLLAKL